jgi:hypothetical protein
MTGLSLLGAILVVLMASPSGAVLKNSPLPRRQTQISTPVALPVAPSTRLERAASAAFARARRQLASDEAYYSTVSTLWAADVVSAEAAEHAATNAVIQRYVHAAGALMSGQSAMSMVVRAHDVALHSTKLSKKIAALLATAQRRSTAAAAQEQTYDTARDRLSFARVTLLSDQIDQLAHPLPPAIIVHAEHGLVAYLARPAPAAVTPGVSILGASVLSASDLAGWYQSMGYQDNTGVPIKQVAAIYLEEGSAEGVRGDVAFAQAVHETGGFAVLSGRNNFAGIGDCSACGGGVNYQTTRMGVRAQVELLKAYDDPTFTQADAARPVAYVGLNTLSVRGAAQTWEQLGTVWAPSASYGTAVLTIYRTMLLWDIARTPPALTRPPVSLSTPAYRASSTSIARHRPPAMLSH